MNSKSKKKLEVHSNGSKGIDLIKEREEKNAKRSGRGAGETAKIVLGRGVCSPHLHH